MFYNPYNTRQYCPFERALARERALAQQQALQRARAQYLPYDDESDAEYYVLHQLPPRERMYLQALKQEEMERRRREEEAMNQQRLEAQRQEQLRREMLLRQYMNSFNLESIQRERSQSGSPHPHQYAAQSKSASPAPSEPIRIRIRTPSPARSTVVSESVPAEATQTPPHSPPPYIPQYSLEDRNEAASKIQTCYRSHRSLRTIHDLAHEFNILKSSFTLPTTLDFQGPDKIITIPSSQSSTTTLDSSGKYTPKLAYTTTNYDLHVYVEALNRLLIRLDGVESWGEKRVREERRRVVRQIEAEAGSVEVYWKGIWIGRTLADTHEPQDGVSEERETREEEMVDVDVGSAEVQPVVAGDLAPSDSQSEEDSDMVAKEEENQGGFTKSRQLAVDPPASYPQREEDSDMETREEVQQRPEVDVEADSVGERPIVVDPVSSDAQDDFVELPQLVSQQDVIDTDSDDADFSEVEDIVTPEEDAVPPVVVAVADLELEPSPEVDTSLVVPPPSKVSEAVISEGLEGDFEMV
ncbi:hypothetical protein BDZ94DRAFT_1232372 [Collybia nuda]|uniref:BAG domain-containing protein n=1 Tax=Collybia nuda TaxID=64659 RepID=A0A9P5YG80_9AGAR|nr:hypothetical protein BDZ94DRAFT_1232372 [Collybia nuda]